MSNDIPPLPRAFTHNYDHDFDLSRLTNAAMYSRDEIERATEDRESRISDPVRPYGWDFPRDAKANLAVLDHTAGSGLVAMTFVNEDKKEVVVAFRGYDNPSRDAGAVVALAADGEALSKVVGTADPLNIGPRGDAKQQLRDGQQTVLGWANGEWHPQFAEGLDHVARVLKAYPDYDVQVTGVGPGGGIAELAAHTYGLNGRSFDPLGAKNVAQSEGYAAYLQERGLTPQGLRAPNGTMDPGGFASWNTKRGTNDWLGGEQIAEARRVVSPAAGREGAADWASYGVGFAADFAAEAPLIGKVGRAGQALDTFGDLAPIVGTVPMDRERMAWMVRAMEETAREHAEQTFGRDDPRQPAHPDHEGYQRLVGMVETEDARLGRTPDAHSENLAASLLVLAKQNNIEPRHIAFSDGKNNPAFPAGDKVFVYDGDPNREPWYEFAGMRTSDAIQRPAADSFKELERVNLALTEKRSQELAMAALQPAPTQPDGPGPRTL